MTEEEFAAKVNYEGGALEALECGLRSTDLAVDGELKRAFETIEQAWKSVNQWIDYTQDIVAEILDGDVPF